MPKQAAQRAPSPPARTSRTIPAGFDMIPRAMKEDPAVTDRAFRVYAAIQSWCWGESPDTWATNRQIAQRSGGCSDDTVRRAVRELAEAGYIEVIKDPTVLAGRRLRPLHVAQVVTDDQPRREDPRGQTRLA